MSDKLIKLNDQFLLIELDGTQSRSGLLDISLLRRVWKAGELTHLGTVPDRNCSFRFAPVGEATDLYFEGDETSIRVNIPFRDVAAIIAGPPDPRQQIVAFVDGKPQTQPVLNYEADHSEEGTGHTETICDDMTVADAIAVLQQFSPHAPLILQAVLPSGEVHGLPIKVFQPRPGAPVGLTMRCQP